MVWSVKYKEFEQVIYGSLYTQKSIGIIMRKLIVDFEPNEMIRELFKQTFELIHSYEVLETLKIDWEEGICIDLIECVLKESASIHDLKSIGHMEILSVLKSEGNRHTCLVKQKPEDSERLFKEFDIDLIHSTPCMISEEKHTYSMIGEQKNIAKFIEQLKKYGNIGNMRFQKAAYQKHDILTVLTDKQKDVLIAAKKHGYYNYPRKIKSEELAQKIGISKNTAIEHLRKAEERIMENILAGY
jgi:predicted DNA binding protein